MSTKPFVIKSIFYGEDNYLRLVDVVGYIRSEALREQSSDARRRVLRDIAEALERLR